MVIKKSSVVSFLSIKERLLLWRLEYKINRNIKKFYFPGKSVRVCLVCDTSITIREILMERCRRAGWTVIFSLCSLDKSTKKLDCLEIG